MSISKEDTKFLKMLGAKLRALREDRGWTLEETEEHGWPNWRHLQQIETGQKNITIITLKNLSNLYSVPISHILNDK